MCDHICRRCKGPMRILFHVEWYCPNDCDRRTGCPKCASPKVEPFIVTAPSPPVSYWNFPMEAPRVTADMHCCECGHCWLDSDNIVKGED